MFSLRYAAIVALGTAMSLGFAQSPSTPSQSNPNSMPSDTQGVGNQRGAGLSPGNSSNGGAGTIQTKQHKHRHHKKTYSSASQDSTPSNATTTPQQ